MKNFFKKLNYKVNSALLSAELKTRKAVSDFVTNERGDTNFISIAIILIIVIAVAVIFIAFKEELMEKFNTKTGDLFSALDDKKAPTNT